MKVTTVNHRVREDERDKKKRSNEKKIIPRKVPTQDKNKNGPTMGKPLINSVAGGL